MIDAHFHSWQLSRGDYGWLTPALPAIYRDVSIADWQAQAAPHSVKAGVLVQALAEMPMASSQVLEGHLDHLIARMGHTGAMPATALIPLADI